MELNDIAHKRHSISTWLSAYADDFAWRWTAEAHYAFLRDRANELLQLGEVSLEARNLMASRAFQHYQFYLQHRAAAETSFCWHYEYQVWEGEKLIAITSGEGHLFEVGTHRLLGCIKAHHGPESELHITHWVDFVEHRIGWLRGLDVERPDGPPWNLVLKQQSPPPKNWAADTPRY